MVLAGPLFSNLTTRAVNRAPKCSNPKSVDNDSGSSRFLKRKADRNSVLNALIPGTKLCEMEIMCFTWEVNI